ncbi:flavin-dependent oxidoreductase [Pigmentiphaga sp. D-2]|uniref:flavin-dependent oxidoreductase n=1 Tax=Pigmentiphaga sp. D-2 TaxID=1002116 RepID=UPI001051F408|nr:flavin-dependent oxidoreductase [Pigmentiphaga sp. D-2]
MEVMIVGGGIGGLTLALSLHKMGIAARVFEAAPDIQALGVGVSLLPHSTRVLGELGLNEALAKVAVTTTTTTFFNRFGQHVYSESTGRQAGYEWPQFQAHRGDLQMILLEACRERLGADRIVAGHRCTGFTQTPGGVTASFVDPAGNSLGPRAADALIACDGLHSVIRKQLHPAEGEPVYSGVNMWRGVTRWKPYFDGATYVRGGWLTPGKMVIYPIRNALDADGCQLINWVAEVTTPRYERRDWNRRGRLEDFIGVFEDWRFDWLDVPAMIRAADVLLEFPMVDQDPLPWWTQGRVTLLGDAAHPMVPRGSNGAGQAILDARALAAALAAEPDVPAALARYESQRRPATTDIVLTNRKTPPDAILKEVYERTGDRPFRHIDDVISQEELAAISNGYKRVAGYDLASLSR